MTAPGGLAIIGFMRAFFPITRKINLLIVISLMLGIGVIIVYFAYTQNLSVREMNRDRLEQQSNILYQSIENIMLPGEALIAVQFLTDVKDTDPTLEIILYRSDGEEAFSDNETIDKVNANLGYEVFPPKTLFQENRMIMRGDDRFNEAVAKRKNALFQKVVDGSAVPSQALEVIEALEGRIRELEAVIEEFIRGTSETCTDFGTLQQGGNE